MKILRNGAWVSSDRILRLGFSLIVGALMARYLTPNLYGAFNYASSFVALVSVFATLGLENIVIREIVKAPSRRDEILGTAFFLKLFGGLFVICVTGILILFVRPGDAMASGLVILTGLAFIPQAIYTIDFYFQAELRSKYTVIANSIAFVTCSIAKLTFIYLGASVYVFVALSSLETLIGGIGIYIFYKRLGFNLSGWRFDRSVAFGLLKDSWPLIFSGVAIMIYMRIDQVMVGNMLGNTSLGQYSAAVKISEVWYFLPLAIVASVYPKIVELKQRSEAEYHLRLQQLFNLMCLMGYVVGGIFCFASKDIIGFVFGKQYAMAKDILSVHIWTGLFIAIGVARGNWLISENRTRFQFMTTAMGAVINILLNIVLIKRYGGIGAAWATLISQAIVGYFSTILIDRKIFLMETRALLFDWRAFAKL